MPREVKISGILKVPNQSERHFPVLHLTKFHLKDLNEFYWMSSKKDSECQMANRSINFDIRIDVIMQPVQHHLI